MINRQRTTPRWGHKGACLAALAISIFVAHAPAAGAEADTALAAAAEAYAEGNYRAAAARLNELSRDLLQLATEQQLHYWDISANIAEASGLYIRAQKAARMHLELLQQARVATGERSIAERNALVRLARINRTLAGEKPQEDSSPQSRSRLLHQAVDLLRDAFQDADDPPRVLWEAEARLELARTFERLGNLQDATQQYARAASFAERALSELQLADDTVPQLERAVTVIQQAAPDSDELALQRQAMAALRRIEGLLTSQAISPAVRGKLLAARADCVRQLNDVTKERQTLEQLTAQGGDPPVVEPLIRAQATVRLAELTDGDAARQQVQALRRQADTLYSDAAALYEQILQTAVKDASSPDVKKRAPSRATQAECLMQLQLIYTRLADWTRAIDAGERLLGLRGKSLLAGSDPNYFRTLGSLGALHARRARSANIAEGSEGRDLSAARSDARKAQQYLEPACQFWRRYVPSSAVELATTLNHYAEALRYNGEFRKADELLREAQPYCRSTYASGDLRLGEYYANHAAVQAALGFYTLAIDNYDAALAAATHPDAADLRERRSLLAMIYLNKAQLHKSQRQLADARMMCDKASQAARDAGLAVVDLFPFDLARASLLIAEAEDNFVRSIASPASPGESESAGRINAVGQNLEAAEEITAKLLADAEAATALQLAGARHLNALANYRRFELCGAGQDALRAAEASWKQIAEADQTHEPSIDILRVRALNHLAAVMLRDVAATRAKAFAASQQADADANFVQLLTNHAESRMQEAESASQAAEQLARSMVAYPGVRAQALFSRAQVLHAAARIALGKARRTRDSGSLGGAISNSHERTAQAKFDDAIDALQSALEIIELPRAMTVGAEEERADYLAQFAPAFDLLVDLLMEQGRIVEAVDIAEKRRSRTFQDQLAAAGVDIYATAKQEHVRRAHELRDNYYTTLDALRQNWHDADRRAKLSQTLAQLQREFVEAERDVKSSSRAARQLRVGSAAGLGSEADAAGDAGAWIRDQIGEEDVALVYYVGAERSYVVAFGDRLGVHSRALTVTEQQAYRRGLWMPPQDGDQSVTTRPLRANDVIALVNDVRALAERPRQEHRIAAADSERGASGLRHTLAAKVGPEHLFIVTDILLPAALRDKIVAARPRNVIVVPDGALHQLPLELLPLDAERISYLLDALPPMCYAPSLHIYRMLRAHATQRTAPLTLLSVADPDYSVANDEIAAVAREVTSVGKEFHHYWDGRLARLESAAEEFAEVTTAFRELGPGQATVIPLISADATERNFTQSLHTRPITMLHVAAHGLISQRHNNLFGALALTTQPRPTAADDGFVALHEVFNLPLRDCDLAVLSACQTNCGPESPLEAGSTMARAFLCAGARRVVSSHWSVSDKATAPLIGGFMRNVARDLRAGRAVDYAAALHAVKLRLRSEPRTAGPYFWAPFVLIGPPSGEEPSAAADSLAAGE